MTGFIFLDKPEGITSFTWPASTVKSGSAIVINNPIKKQAKTKINTFLDLVSPDPTYFPIGVIAISAPKLNNPIPRIKNRADTINTIISLLEKLLMILI